MKLLVLLALCGLCYSQSNPWEVITPLDEYVAQPESAYGYEFLYKSEGQGLSIHFLRLTSLTWFDETLTTTPEWWHYLTICIPDNLVYTDSLILYISGGDNGDDVPDVNTGNVQDMVGVANNTGAITAVLTNIPFQPVYFTDEENGTNPRIEDAIIGYTWRLFIEETVTDPDVILLFPMVKAAKQAVDAVVEYTANENPAIVIDKVLPTGFSKRGWTTWLLGCVDQRVMAMAPIVFDLLNFYENLQHHYMSLGGWSWAFAPYYNTEVPKYLHHERTQLIGSHIDPLEYNDRLTMPKLLSGSSGDQFFLPTGTHFWWDKINGTDNHYILFENDDHGVGGHRDLLWENLEAFFISVHDGIQLPQYSVSRPVDDVAETGTITVDTVTTPNWVRAWWADNTNRTCEPNDNITGVCRRDFRMDRWDLPLSTLIEWESEDLVDGGGGSYSVSYDFRTDFGYKIFHVEMGFPGPGGREFHLSTESNVLPYDFPFPICQSEEECQGVLK